MQNVFAWLQGLIAEPQNPGKHPEMFYLKSVGINQSEEEPR